MQITAAELKAQLKKFAPVKADTLVLDTITGTLSAEDNDLHIHKAVPALKAPEGLGSVIQVSLRKLSATISRLPGALTVTVRGNSLHIQSVKSEFTLEVLAATAPKPLPKPKQLRALPLAEVKTLLKVAATATQKGHEQHADIVLLTGAYSATGTNNLRVMIARSAQTSVEEFTTVLPIAAVAALEALAGEEVVMGETEGAVVFYESGDAPATVAVRRVAKAFPPVAAALDRVSAGATTHVTVDADVVRAALQEVAPFVPGDEGQRRVQVAFTLSALTVQAKHGGSARATVAYQEPLPGEEDEFLPVPKFTLWLNHAYLLDFFEAVTGTVTIRLSGNTAPILLDGGSRQALVSAMAVE